MVHAVRLLVGSRSGRGMQNTGVETYVCAADVFGSARADYSC